MSNDIEVYYKNRKFAGVVLYLFTPILIILDSFLIISTFGDNLTILKDFKSVFLMFIFFLALSVGFIFMTKWFITRMYRIKWLLVTVNGSRITMRDKRRNTFCIDVSEIESIDWKFVKHGKYRRGIALWQESLVIKTGSRSFIVPNDYMDGYKRFLAYLQQNVAPEKIKKIKIDYSKR